GEGLRYDGDPNLEDCTISGYKQYLKPYRVLAPEDIYAMGRKGKKLAKELRNNMRSSKIRKNHNGKWKKLGK
ncbi:hypothetical protein KDA11_00070, partial [Candidatus Saccharibacteria bacterium]|nr:hypothetical protein [Candidatus Saccharibacteria bacterium]